MIRLPQSRRVRVIWVKLRAISDRIRSNLFFIPVLYVVGAIALAEILIFIDARLVVTDVPPFVRTTVDGGRKLLGAVAGGIITIIGLVFSLVVVAFQLASSQYSPRALSIFFRSRLQQHTMGFLVGTFTYCLFVLHSLRSFYNASSQDVIPSLSTTTGLLLAILAVLVILAYVDRTSRAMQVSELIRQITQQTISTVLNLTTDTPETREAIPKPEEPPEDQILVVRATRAGWVQQAPPDALLNTLPPKHALRLDVRIGAYVEKDAPLCAVYTSLNHPVLTQRLIQTAIDIRSNRSMQGDIEFGLWQLNDIALRALSPGVNVPNTAIDAIVHLGTVLATLLKRELSPKVLCDGDGRRVERPNEYEKRDYIALAFNQIRAFSGTQPEVAQALLHTLGMLLAIAREREDEACAKMIREQALLVLASARQASLHPYDLQRIYVTGREAGLDPDDGLTEDSPS